MLGVTVAIPATSGLLLLFFFLNVTATTEIYTLSLHDALPISQRNDRVVHLRQTTWTLFLMRPVVGSTNRRGNFRTGAEMISDASRRSTAAFATAAFEIGRAHV